MSRLLRVSKLDDAIRFAAKLHDGQAREGDHPLPYVVHPIEVLINLRHVGGVVDEEMLVAAILHDTVEETKVELGQIEKQFGERTRRLVEELTRQEPTEKEIDRLAPKEIWKLRAEMLLAEIGKMSQDAQVIKLADRLSNIKEANRSKKGKKLERYVGQTRRILEIVPRAVSPGLWDAIGDELKHP